MWGIDGVVYPWIVQGISALMEWGSILAFTAPLRRRPHYLLRALAAGIFLWLTMIPTVRLHPNFLWMLWFLIYACQVIAIRVLTPMGMVGSAYCAVWSTMLTQLAAELGILLWYFLQPQGWTNVQMIALIFLETGLLQAVISLTVARSMPTDGAYKPGPRQYGSAVALGGIYCIQFEMIVRMLLNGQMVGYTAVSNMLLQLYCLTLLYLQTELFKKSAMEKELSVLNALSDRQREQYAAARRSVALINKKCHELKVQIAALEKLLPEGEARQTLNEAREVIAKYDAYYSTGNESLDVVLSEKKMDCECRGIQLNCIADGACIGFIAPADLYVLFSNLLDEAMEAAERESPARRLLDLLVCRTQGVVVIRLTQPTASQGQRNKVACSLVTRYGGIHQEQQQGEFVVWKAIFPG
ncbi:MAG: hypothetical protein ACI4OL_06360 [Gemmiger sp.]